MALKHWRTSQHLRLLLHFMYFFYNKCPPPYRMRMQCERPCSHCRSCSGTVPICRINRVCERALSAIKLISDNLIRSRVGSVFRHNYLCRNKCNVNTDYTYVGERWRCRLDIINVVLVNGSQCIYLWRRGCRDVAHQHLQSRLVNGADP